MYDGYISPHTSKIMKEFVNPSTESNSDQLEILINQLQTDAYSVAKDIIFEKATVTQIVALNGKFEKITKLLCDDNIKKQAQNEVVRIRCADIIEIIQWFINNSLSLQFGTFNGCLDMKKCLDRLNSILAIPIFNFLPKKLIFYKINQISNVSFKASGEYFTISEAGRILEKLVVYEASNTIKVPSHILSSVVMDVYNIFMAYEKLDIFYTHIHLLKLSNNLAHGYPKTYTPKERKNSICPDMFELKTYEDLSEPRTPRIIDENPFETGINSFANYDDPLSDM